MSTGMDLDDQLTALLDQRPGWHLEPSTTPGMGPTWCFTHDGDVLVGVGSADGALWLSVPDRDLDGQVQSIDELTQLLVALGTIDAEDR